MLNRHREMFDSACWAWKCLSCTYTGSAFSAVPGMSRCAAASKKQIHQVGIHIATKKSLLVPPVCGVAGSRVLKEMQKMRKHPRPHPETCVWHGHS